MIYKYITTTKMLELWVVLSEHWQYPQSLVTKTFRYDLRN